MRIDTRGDFERKTDRNEVKDKRERGESAGLTPVAKPKDLILLFRSPLFVVEDDCRGGNFFPDASQNLVQTHSPSTITHVRHRRSEWKKKRKVGDVNSDQRAQPCKEGIREQMNNKHAPKKRGNKPYRIHRKRDISERNFPRTLQCTVHRVYFITEEISPYNCFNEKAFT